MGAINFRLLSLLVFAYCTVRQMELERWTKNNCSLFGIWANQIFWKSFTNLGVRIALFSVRTKKILASKADGKKQPAVQHALWRWTRPLMISGTP